MLEDIGVAEHELEFMTLSQQLKSWISGEMQVNWELHFAKNIFLNKRDWLKNVKASHKSRKRDKAMLNWNKLIPDQEERTVIWQE